MPVAPAPAFCAHRRSLVLGLRRCDHHERAGPRDRPRGRTQGGVGLGAFAWADAWLVAFGNDLTDVRTLIAVTAASNQQKGDSDPSNWLPPLASAQCPFIGNWLAIKARWD